MGRRTKKTRPWPGQMIGAPLRLYLKTKDHRRGQSAVFGFRSIAPQIRPRALADLRFHGDCRDRPAFAGVVRAVRRTAGAASGQGGKPAGDRRRSANALRPLTARRSGSPSVSGRRHDVGAGTRSSRRPLGRVKWSRSLIRICGGFLFLNANHAVGERPAFRPASSAARSSRACSRSRPPGVRCRASPIRPP
jgi:hypothetical protein